MTGMRSERRLPPRRRFHEWITFIVLLRRGKLRKIELKWMARNRFSVGTLIG